MKTLTAALIAGTFALGATSLAHAQAYEELANPALAAHNPASAGDFGTPSPYNAPLFAGRSVAADQYVGTVPSQNDEWSNDRVR